MASTRSKSSITQLGPSAPVKSLDVKIGRRARKTDIDTTLVLRKRPIAHAASIEVDVTIVPPPAKRTRLAVAATSNDKLPCQAHAVGVHASNMVSKAKRTRGK
jgi:hypothetical protein